jgi:pyruvate/2-oxoglutarate dehydrogenase complex dihydrolipoamide acyltransferase (E2) component
MNTAYCRRMRTFELPDLGEGLAEAEIIRWHVNTGDHVQVGPVVARILISNNFFAEHAMTFDHRCAGGGEAARFMAAIIRDLQKGN